MKVTVLLFHRVHPERDPLWDPMDPVLFESILLYARKNYEPVGLDEFFQDVNRKYKKRPLIITYDDGYRDFIDYSFPLLKKHSLPASMFVVTDCIDRNIPTWTYLMDYFFYNTKILEIKNADFGLPVQEFNVTKWHTDAERIAYCKKVKQYLKKVPNKKRNEIVQTFTTGFDDVQMPENLMMTWEEIKQLQSAGVQIGSHSVSHPPLATIEDENELKTELLDSALRIKEMTGKFPSTISYPVGSYNSGVKKMSEQVGYQLGLAVNQRIFDTNRDDNFEIPRIELYNENMIKAKLRITGIYGKLKRMAGK